MKVFAILLVCIVELVYADINPQCSICKSSVDWMRSNENVLSAMKTDYQLSQDVIGLIESDRSSKSLCGLLAMCETNEETEVFLSNLRYRKCIYAFVEFVTGFANAQTID